MTAEVSVMNRQGIALAADSAVTLREQQGQKIFTSANKIFGLSKVEPVAIMIYGSADCMGIPWETIIKLYRSDIGRRSFASLEDYATDFLNFCGTTNSNFSRRPFRDSFF